MTVASDEVNKILFVRHVTKVKPKTSCNSITDLHVIPFFSAFNIPFESKASIKPKDNKLLFTSPNI